MTKIGVNAMHSWFTSQPASLSIQGLACDAAGPNLLHFSLHDVPRHGQQGQQAGLVRVLHFPKPLLVLSL